MDKKILAVLVVIIVAAAGGATAYALTHQGGKNTSDDKFIDLGRTNEYFPDHTCCVIIANDKWVEDNPEVAARFMGGYVDAMQFLSTALSNPGSDDYNSVVDVIAEVLTSANLTRAEIEKALSNINYLYADSAAGDLSGLKSSIAQLVDQLDSVNAISEGKKPANPTAWANSFVNETPLADGIALSPGSYATANVEVACIAGDIHQIGVHLAQRLGYFANYGINATFSTANNGGGVVTALIQNGATAKIGVVGAPPSTLNAINQDLSAEKHYSVLARANSVGSGLYIKASAVDDATKDVKELTRNGTKFFSVSGSSYVVAPENAAAWKGLIFGTPGTTSIQHIQLGTIANSLGLEFLQYTEGQSTDGNAIYYVTNIPNAQQTISNKVINAGILWEPQYTKIIS